MGNKNGKWKWVDMDNNIWECAECEYKFTFDEADPYENNCIFCPACQSRMIPGEPSEMEKKIDALEKQIEELTPYRDAFEAKMKLTGDMIMNSSGLSTLEEVGKMLCKEIDENLKEVNDDK